VVCSASALPGSRVMEQPGPRRAEDSPRRARQVGRWAGSILTLGLAAILLMLVSRKRSLDPILICHVRERSDKVCGSYGKAE
jgi:hypothetical protein